MSKDKFGNTPPIKIFDKHLGSTVDHNDVTVEVYVEYFESQDGARGIGVPIFPLLFDGRPVVAYTLDQVVAMDARDGEPEEQLSAEVVRNLQDWARWMANYDPLDRCKVCHLNLGESPTPFYVDSTNDIDYFCIEHEPYEKQRCFKCNEYVEPNPVATYESRNDVSRHHRAGSGEWRSRTVCIDCSGTFSLDELQAYEAGLFREPLVVRYNAKSNLQDSAHELARCYMDWALPDVEARSLDEWLGQNRSKLTDHQIDIGRAILEIWNGTSERGL